MITETILIEAPPADSEVVCDHTRMVFNVLPEPVERDDLRPVGDWLREAEDIFAAAIAGLGGK